MSGLALAALLTLSSTSAETATTAAPRIDLVTVGVGGETYAAFGHAAIRVVYPDGRDTSYNFGGVDTEQPAFWRRTVQGRLETYLDVKPYSDLLLEYSAEDRTIVGRTLRFTPAQARALVAELDAIHADPARKTYVYHHFDDNCTTRIAEVFDRVLDGRLAAGARDPVRGTRRSWILDRIRYDPWLFLVMDVSGTGEGDGAITAWDTIFLPDGLDRIVDAARIDGRPFVTRRYVDYTSMSFDAPVLWDWPWTKVYILFLTPLLGLMAWRARPAALLWGLAAGGIGLALSALWAITDYTFYQSNWNVLLCPPTHLGLALAALSRRRFTGRAVSGYVAAHAVVVLAVLGGRAAGVVQHDVDPVLGLALPLSVMLWVAQRRARRALQSGLPLGARLGA